MATTTKARKTGGGKKKDAPDPQKAQKANREMFRINLQNVTTSFNHRYPLSKFFHEQGYGVFPDDVPPGSDKPPLWKLATSNDPMERLKYVELMDELDGEEKDGGGIRSLAWNIISVGLINPVNVRDNGNDTYQLVAGHRRSLAVLYLWCKGISKPPFPVIEAKFEKGNNTQLQAIALSENVHRKRLSLIEQARAYQMAMNGGETAEQIAEREHCSVQTVNQRISLLTLPPEDQKKVEEGRLKYADAIEVVRDLKAGGPGRTKTGRTASEAADAHTAKGGSRNRMMSRKEVETWWASETDGKVKQALARILKMDGGDDSSSNGIAGSGKKGVRDQFVLPDKVVPGATGTMEEGEAEEIQLDSKGRPVVGKK